MKLRYSNVKKDKGKPNPKNAKIKTAAKIVAVLAVAGAISACERIEKNYYGDTGEESVCAPVSERCSNVDSRTARCSAFEGVAVELDDYLFIAKEVTPDGVTIEVQDKQLGCVVVGSVEMPPYPEPESLDLVNARYEIKVHNVAPSPDGTAYSADIEVKRDDTPRCEWGELEEVRGIVNIGEVLPLPPDGELSLRLDDLSSDGHGIIFSIVDSLDNILHRGEVGEGSAWNYMGPSMELTVSTDEVAAGYTFEARWADITVWICYNI